jgi:hypothetical protein
MGVGGILDEFGVDGGVELENEPTRGVCPLVDIARVVHGTPGLGEGVKTGGGAAITVLDEFGEVGVGVELDDEPTTAVSPFVSVAYIDHGSPGAGDGVKTGGGGVTGVVGVVGARCGGGGGLGIKVDDETTRGHSRLAIVAGVVYRSPCFGEDVKTGGRGVVPVLEEFEGAGGVWRCRE